MKKVFLLQAFYLSICFLHAQQWSPNSPHLYFNTGNVGIGTMSPNSNMHVYTSTGGPFVVHGKFENVAQNGRSQVIVTSGPYPSNFFALMTHGVNVTENYYATGTGATTDAGKGILLGQGTGMSEFIIGTYNAKPLTLFTNNTARLIIQPGGNIGLGTYTPRSRLDVFNGELLVTGTDINGTVYVTSRTGIAYFGNNSYNNGIAVTGSGNVGIGTTNTGPYKLAVEGFIGTRKIKVTQVTPFADYVFEKDYPLPSLQEVEQFIERHKHLPDVPSAKEVEANGLDLGDNQVVLLKKIEELTLYMIEQNKKSEEQQKRIESLEKEIRLLHGK